MRVWLIVIPCSYIALLCALAYPLLHLAFNADIGTLGPAAAVAEAFDPASIDPDLYRSPWFHGWVLVLATAQVALLLPAGRPSERPRPRRPLAFALVAAAFLAGLLSASLLIAILGGIWGDDTLDMLDSMFDGLSLLPDTLALPLYFSPLMAAWGLWWFILLKATKTNPSPRFPQRACRWLLAGSALELIVAVPCHVISRNRDDCCAPAGTFFGIACGTSVALLCCGPALLFLVRDRLRKKTPRASMQVTDEQNPAGSGGGDVLSE